IPVSRQFHSHEPLGKSFASLYGSASPSTSSRPHETSLIRGERLVLSMIVDSDVGHESKSHVNCGAHRVTRPTKHRRNGRAGSPLHAGGNHANGAQGVTRPTNDTTLSSEPDVSRHARRDRCAHAAASDAYVATGVVSQCKRDDRLRD